LLEIIDYTLKYKLDSLTVKK